MKIAFTSCFSAQSFKQQPVWTQVGASGATHLVLLGDSAYYDADGSDMGAVKAMGAHDFALHAFGRLRDQLNQKEFAKLVRDTSLRIHPIWDDHDFLWNGACGAQIEGQPSYRHLLDPTRAAFQAYRDALDSHDPKTFPKPADGWASGVPEPGYRTLMLSNAGDPDGAVMLHLTDGRSYKTKGGEKAVLGSAQMKKLKKTIEESDEKTVHLIASGLTFEARHGETWMDCVAEHAAILALAAARRILILSGDVHENRFAVPWPTGPWSLFEATSSGAALRTAVTIGALQCNWGLVDITKDQVSIELSQLHMDTRRRVIDRKKWKML
ncbi:hypothetical protein [Variovorax sp. EBFNA2]|uniref:hypothetical protein n=1 Tax=Variovorax sp. EBFNA2 TaxID=3342097 RepID=UPI0029C09953|nr:hypothetical protein [Variovorax boronicumulans]WPG39263.1 hypothetical protein RZE79_07990 [Variovorax boronicumulans]